MRTLPGLGSRAVTARARAADVRAMQERLVKQGADVGKVDGLVGFKTRISIGAWEEANGRAATCFPDAGLLKAIR